MSSASTSFGQEAMAPDDGAAPDRLALQRQGLKRLWFVLPWHVLTMVLMLWSVSAGRIPAGPSLLVLAFDVVGMAAFFAIVGSRLALRFADPMLAFPQVVFAITLVALASALIEPARAIALEWLCLIIVYDMRRLPRRQVVIAAVLAMALPALGVALKWAWQPGDVPLRDQLLFIALGAVMVPALLVVSGVARRLLRRRLQQKEQLARTLARLEELAIRDGLTGLYNRRHMMALLESEARRASRTGRPFCIALLDLDLFKQVNDRLGHAMGDTVLRHFAALLKAGLKGRPDAAGRWGGEEFMLLLPETTEAQAHAALLQLRDIVRGYDWAGRHPELRVSFSAGICEHAPQAALRDTIEWADQALYRAKQAGRDRVETRMPVDEAALRAAQAVLQPRRIVPDELELPSLAEPAGGADSTSPAPLAPEHAPPAGASATARPRGLAQLLFGSDRMTQAALRLCLMTSGIYVLLMIAMALYGIPTGLIPLQTGIGFLVTQFIGATVPYALVRSGITAHWKDPGLVLPQMAWAVLALIASYVVLPDGRAYSLQVLCAVVVFGFVDLRPRTALVFGVWVCFMLVAAFGLLIGLRPQRFEPVHEAIQVGTTVVILMVLSLQSRLMAQMREQVRAERFELAAKTDELRRMMAHDALTGVYNRQHIQALLARECERHERSGHSFSIALIDLDHFKRINDTLGHQVGDEVLQGFVKAAAAHLRDTDAIGRWGGEEFLLILPDAEPGPQGLTAAERLRESIARQQLCASAPGALVTFSAGVAVHARGETITQLMERADRALYEAKAQGRNRSVLAPAAAAVSG